MHIISPLNGQLLRPDAPHSLSDGTTRFPLVDGIAFLRSGRDELRLEALHHLDRGDSDGALVALLADQDDFARTPAATPSALRQLLAEMASGCSLRRAMDLLAFGPVGTYFAHRWSTPTFLSALGLVDRYWSGRGPFIEIACGIGQILRDVAARGRAVVGIDVVFAKLWLARRFIVPEAALVCADVETGIPLQPIPGATVLCHDAFYFIERKDGVLAEMRRIAGGDGSVLIGHAHNASFDHRIAGTPLDPAGYQALAPDASLYDDAAFAAEALGEGRATAEDPDRLRDVEAISMAIGPERASEPFGAAALRTGRALRLNPLLAADASGLLEPDWPDDRFVREYGSTPYLRTPMPSEALLAEAAAGRRSPAIDDLARRRILLDLPAAW